MKLFLVYIHILGLVAYFDICFCFLNNECSYYLKTNAQIERKLEGNGFHRTIHTFVDVSSQENMNDCTVLIKETFPSGAYVDPSQLTFLRDFGGPAFFIPQFINVESPEHSSPEISAFFFTKLKQNSNGNWHGNITLPVHLRYHRSKQGSYESLKEIVTFPHPSIFLMCENQMSEACIPIAQLEPCPPMGIQQCDWLPVSTFSMSDWVIATVPVGNVDLVDTVLLTTTSITCAAAILLLIAMFRSPDSRHVNRSKSVL